MEHEHRDTRLNYDYSVATYFQRKHAYTETPPCAILQYSIHVIKMLPRMATPRLPTHVHSEIK
jgi:hypothetical protein